MPLRKTLYQSICYHWLSLCLPNSLLLPTIVICFFPSLAKGLHKKEKQNVMAAICISAQAQAGRGEGEDWQLYRLIMQTHMLFLLSPSLSVFLSLSILLTMATLL